MRWRNSIAIAFTALFSQACGGAVPAPKPVHTMKTVAPPPVLSPCEANDLAPPLAHPRWPSKAVAGPITGVRFRGQTGASAELEAVLSSKPGTEFDPLKIELDIRRLWALGRFDDVAIEADTTNGDLVLVYVVEERKAIGKIDIEGIKSLPADEVAAATEMHSGAPFDPSALYRTAMKLRQKYSDAGYRFAKLEPHALRGNVVDVCLRVDEGAKVLIDKWIWKGAAAMTPERLGATSQPGVNAAGGIFRADVWARDALILTSLYYDQGYLTVKIGEPELALSADKASMIVTVAIEEGLAYRIGKLAFAGDKLKNEKAYFTEMSSKVGQVFSRTKVLADMDRVRALHAAKQEKIEIAPDTTLDPIKGTVDLVFKIAKVK